MLKYKDPTMVIYCREINKKMNKNEINQTKGLEKCPCFLNSSMVK
ncbi:hypothetical protein XJ76305_1182 [Enterococcus faecalis]|nr:hypothetical protein HMPREF9503_02507 [Enterococcus faecalis TX0043]OSH27454.1 hypothetical protein QH294_1226 [Enterococcus faecalis]OSH29785.1 hypothetical protein EFQH95_1528 [Enterococcus faecalis]OSH36059.1 hypothetical protein XJ76305_1182 [Enterococcus faecalis]